MEEPPHLTPEPLSVAAARAERSGRRVAVRGHAVTSADTTVLCEILAESWPPQPGGAVLPVEGLDVGDLPDARTLGHSAWTDEPVVVEGRLEGGVLHLGPASR